MAVFTNACSGAASRPTNPAAHVCIRACVAPDGTVVDDSVLLYDQAFALLGYASAFDVFNDESLRDSAHQLLDTVCLHLRNATGGFRESPDRDLPLTRNSHMHLFEAALAWMALDHDKRWRSLAEQLVQLALTRFVDPATAQIREFFTAEWAPAAGEMGRIVEPGHQFERAWLLLRWHAFSQDTRAAVLVHLGTLRQFRPPVLRALSIRAPLPIPSSVTSHDVDTHGRTRTVPCESGGRVRFQRS
jgi:mannose/cellobiose epimerase-like protein (N-acyl-D-glucosamine 2-epimerase family)